MYICVCMYVCIYIYIYFIYVYTYIYIYRERERYVCICIYIYIEREKCIYIGICILHVCIHIHICIYIYMYIHICLHTFADAPLEFPAVRTDTPEIKQVKFRGKMQLNIHSFVQWTSTGKVSILWIIPLKHKHPLESATDNPRWSLRCRFWCALFCPPAVSSSP